MKKRDVIIDVLEGRKPAYVPWEFGFTVEAAETLIAHFGSREELNRICDNHFCGYGNGIGFYTQIGEDLFQDVFGVVWDRTVDKDIGNVVNRILPQTDLAGFQWPDPLDECFFAGLSSAAQDAPDHFRRFDIGFSLWERAWTLRGGMAQLMMDLYDAPQFVHALLTEIADYNITQAKEAMRYEIDAVYFGDDWGMQHGLQMGPKLWKEFIYPQLKRMYGAVRAEGKYVFIHSCGDVDELFDDLVGIGLNCFNPFQPEVMDVAALLERYRGRLAFHGGLSSQQVLPYGTAEDVRRETRRLIELGGAGGYIFAPSHGVEGDVPLENMLAFIETIQAQEAYQG
ncbi:MAG: hypothetical protein JW750_10910 [Anaerolineaceae bacterium]|nr:hypothetical protein [Anaerolineaceae bacterium]